MVGRDLVSDNNEPEDQPASAEHPSSSCIAGPGLAKGLFWGMLALYLLTRVIGLVDYPIYFFCDEAIQTNLAADFLRDGCRNQERELFPTYFKNYTIYNLSTSVYAQVIPKLLFRNSVFVTRVTAMLFTILAICWVSLILRDCFKLEHWWSGGLLLSIAPAWFLHSRTAFETTMMTSFYAGFIYEYLRYRGGDRRRLPLALLWGTVAFYSYSPGRVVVVVTGLIFLLADLRYHWRNKRAALAGAGLLFVFALPFVRFLVTHPTANRDQLRALASYWLRPIPQLDKFMIFAGEYLEGLNPLYWFLPNTIDISRHVMGPHPHILTLLLPFFLIGIIVALVSLKQPPFRLLLLTLIAVPAGAAVVELGVTRAMAYLIPAVLLIALGLDWVLKRLSDVVGWRPNHIAVGLFVVLAMINVALLATALTKGPTWDEDYTMSGMQWGARQLFPAIGLFKEEHPDTDLLVSPTWANGTDTVARFFFPDGAPFEMGSAKDVEHTRRPELETWVFIVTPEEFQSLEDSGKFAEIEILQTIPYPNEQPGFFFLRLSYKDNIHEILQAERDERHRPREATLRAWGNDLLVHHPLLDMGTIAHVFDGDEKSLARTQEANPLVLEIQLEREMTASGVWFVTGSSPMSIEVTLFAPESEEPIVIRAMEKGKLENPRITVDFGRSHVFDRVRLVLTDTSQQEPGNVHLWELRFID